MSRSQQTLNFYQYRHRQRGAALLVMLVIVVMGASAALVGSLSITTLKNARQEKTATALAQAKEALIGYAASDTNRPGELPCPDINNDGIITITGVNADYSGSNCISLIGRLPWKTLGLPDLRDASGERLWYAVSDPFHANSTVKLNSDTAGTLTVSGNITASNIIAIVFAPGQPLPANNRSAANINNHSYSLESVVTAPTSFSLLTPNDQPGGNHTYNDQIITLSTTQLLPLVEKRIAREVKKCLDDYAANNNYKYPWAVSASASTVTSPLFSDKGGYSTTLFGRLPILPNVQTEPTPTMIATMQSSFDALWTALATFAASKTSSNRTAMRSKADAAKDAADDVKDYYDHTPLEDPANDLKDAADDAYDDLTTSSSAAAIAAIQQDIINAANDFTTAMASKFPPDSGMANDWNTPLATSCTIFSSTYWNDWKDLVFYQVASGYRPGSTPDCGTSCLSISGSGNPNAGSGNYRAAVIIAGKKLGTQTRTSPNTNPPNNYLSNGTSEVSSDPAFVSNAHNHAALTKAFITYKPSDPYYQNVNDLVLCLDGKVNCK